MKLEIGAQAVRKQRVTYGDVEAFQQATGYHILDTEGDRTTVASVFAANIIARLIESEIPGKRKVYLSQSLKFRNAMYLDDEVTAKILIEYYRDDEVMVRTTCFNQKDMLVLDGNALLMIEMDEG